MAAQRASPHMAHAGQACTPRGGCWVASPASPVHRLTVFSRGRCHPQNVNVTIQDMVRGEVTWNTDTLGDFVVLRSNGMPVYNFCVAVDDALMGITHVLR
jgi:glutamyl-tRNA synthetase